jgi:predicted GIY-YIG superfamily endonuclease
MSAPAGVVYLLHFDRPYGHARHYLGWAKDLDRRLIEHQTGAGARLVQVAINAGVSFELARTWSGSRQLERRLKTLGSRGRVCPICSPRRRWGMFSRGARR